MSRPLGVMERQLLDAIAEFRHVRVDHLTLNRDRRSVLIALAELRRRGLVRSHDGRVYITDKGRGAA